MNQYESEHINDGTDCNVHYKLCLLSDRLKIDLCSFPKKNKRASKKKTIDLRSCHINVVFICWETAPFEVQAGHSNNLQDVQTGTGCQY